MIIGVPREIKEQEQRVALIPSSAEQLTKRGHNVVVEKNAGIGSGYSDEEYKKAGAEIVDLAKDVFVRADLIVKVKEPLTPEFPLLRKGQILFTYLHLAASKPLTDEGRRHRSKRARRNVQRWRAESTRPASKMSGKCGRLVARLPGRGVRRRSRGAGAGRAHRRRPGTLGRASAGRRLIGSSRNRLAI